MADNILISISDPTPVIQVSISEKGTKGDSISSGSLIQTASVSLNTLTFTKGDNSTFNITVDTGSAVTTPTGSLLTTASITDGIVTFTKGDNTTFTLVTNSGSFSGSFYGDGTGLSGVTSYTDSDTLSFINSISVLSGSYQVTGSTAIHTQLSPATTWSFNHNLGESWPPIQVYDENRYVLIPSNIKSVDVNNTELHFTPAQAGYASATVGGINYAGNETVEHLQTSASLVWVVNHNLGKLRPIITVYDGTGEVAQPYKIQPVDENRLNVVWTSPETGSAILGGNFISFNSMSAAKISLDTAGFGTNISSSDDTVQKAMLTLSNLELRSGSFSGSFQGDGNSITGIDFNSLAPKFKSTSSIASLDVDWNASFAYTKTLTGNTVFTFSNLYVGIKTLIITGNFTVGFPTGFTLTNGSEAYDGTKVNLIEVICWDTITPTGLVNITYSV